MLVTDQQGVQEGSGVKWVVINARWPEEAGVRDWPTGPHEKLPSQFVNQVFFASLTVGGKCIVVFDGG